MNVTMRDIIVALEAVPGSPVVTTNMAHAIAQALNTRAAPTVAVDCSVVCQASKVDGVTCPNNDCDIDTGTRAAPTVAVHGLPKRFVNPGYRDDGRYSFIRFKEDQAYNECLDAFLPIVAGLRAEVERLTTLADEAGRVGMRAIDERDTLRAQLKTLVDSNTKFARRHLALIERKSVLEGLLLEAVERFEAEELPHTAQYFRTELAALSADEGREDG